ncbi:hypothetical protein M011DRAFT_397576 [Sporormia fimetaria CBS 119925]|uniref:Uncharacterized protein n=1 Tax=Sporormia fimetaria CBS 119925 TaxID=1340428 RepID=A0A6A6VIJ5_9PLEO|nr:hypothetical protein M011DRAFT_397576 [Sporormia fimetaria CBS 119925]
MTNPIRPSADTQRVASYGRGGAGNMTTDNPSAHRTPEDLVTPSLKTEHYTTGRGGTGNMARNDPLHPEIARASQDVEAPPHREPEGVHFIGRGGGGNVSKKEGTKEGVVVDKEGREEGRKSGEGKGGLVEKGKEILGKLKK